MYGVFSSSLRECGIKLLVVIDYVDAFRLDLKILVRYLADWTLIS